MHVCRRQRAEKGMGRARRVRRERQGAWVTELGLSIHTDVRRSQGHVASMMGARQVHDGCVDISTNT